jgi:predicted aspartyl protease
MKRALCAAIAVASGFLCTAADAQTCGLVKAAGYDMVVTKGGHIAINFQIGDETKLMVIDTGGFISTLTLDAVTQMNLKKREGAVMMIDAYGHKINEVAIAPTVTIGPLKIEDTEFLVTSMSYDPEAVGALGPNVLRPFDIELDFAGRKVNFFTQDHCPGRVVYWTNSGSGHVPFSYDPSRHISFTSVLDGKEINTILDTGAPNSLISAPAAHQMYDLTTTSPGVDEQSGTRADGTRWQAYFHRFNSLAIGAVSISNPILQIIPDSVARNAQDPFANADHDPTAHLTPLVLGLRELQYLHMYISYKEKVIYVTDANAH